MKCPKCDYLGFETGDRCKNCGYDFSLLAFAEPAYAVAGADARIRLEADADAVQDVVLRSEVGEDTGAWLDDLDRALDRESGAPLDAALVTPASLRSLHVPSVEPATASAPATGPRVAVGVITPPAVAAVAPPPPPPQAPGPVPLAPVPLDLDPVPPMPPPSFRGEPVLPLFPPAGVDDDEPLIRVPSAPRAPLAVRRTPDTPRLRAVPKGIERPVPDPEPALNFVDEPVRPPALSRTATPVQWLPSAAGPRAFAALVDYAILVAVDLVVVYLTVRMASLTMGEWERLPLAPLAGFLALLKLSYFAAFTAVGGQTIGKMAAHIRVLDGDNRPLDPAHAVRRTLAGAVSFLTVGLGWVPALFAADRRALHDRLAGTRVVSLPSA